jgi:hypothetical protein
MYLGSDYNLVAAGLEDAAQYFLGSATHPSGIAQPVDIGTIDEVDAGVDGVVDEPFGLLRVVLASQAHSEGDRRDLHSCRPKIRVFHGHFSAQLNVWKRLSVGKNSSRFVNLDFPILFGPYT